MTEPAADRLQRLLGGDDLAWLRARLREALERGEPPATLTLRTPTSGQRQRVADLLGTRLPAGSAVTVRVADVEAVLVHSGAAPDLRAAVERLDGPLRDRRAEHADAAARWAQVTAQLDGAVDARPELAGWRDRLAGGLLRRLCDDPDSATSLVRSALAVLDRLPAADLGRGVLAGQVLGDAHALDDDRPLTTVVLLGAAALTGTQVGQTAEDRRAVWLAAGVLTGDVTVPVLTLGLPGDADGPTGRALGGWREAGQPVHLNLRQLERDPPRLAMRGRTVFVCENPVVVAAAADHLGATAGPLVCLGGQPAGAARLLLRQLSRAGAQLAVRGDFDVGGVTIVSGVLRRVGGRPWRFDAETYLRALAEGRGGTALTGRVPDTPWDAALGRQLVRAGVRVEEEALLPDLLADLAT